MAENKEVWEDWAAESLPDVDVSEASEMPSWYGKPIETQETTGEIRNPDNDVYSRISRLVGKIKNVPGVMSYYAHKVADPMYANVDYMGQHIGDWAAKKVNNVARAFDISPEARQYGRFEEEEYDPEKVDVRFGKNAYKEGYDNLGDYLEARDQEKVDRYRGYNHANRFAPIEGADENFYNLSDTQAMEDWQPETTSGKIAKGAIETAGNMLPENLKALAEEKGIVAGGKMLGALAPFYKDVLNTKRHINDHKRLALESEIVDGDTEGKLYHSNWAKKYRKDIDKLIGEKRNAIELERINRAKHAQRGAGKLNGSRGKKAYRQLEELKKQLTPEQFQEIMQERYGQSPLEVAKNPEASEVVNMAKKEREWALEDSDVMSSIRRNRRKLGLETQDSWFDDVLNDVKGRNWEASAADNDYAITSDTPLGKEIDGWLIRNDMPVLPTQGLHEDAINHIASAIRNGKIKDVQGINKYYLDFLKQAEKDEPLLRQLRKMNPQQQMKALFDVAYKEDPSLFERYPAQSIREGLEEMGRRIKGDKGPSMDGAWDRIDYATIKSILEELDEYLYWNN